MQALTKTSRAHALILFTACFLLAIGTACGPATTADVAAIEFRLSGAPVVIGEVDLPEGRFSLMLPAELAAGDVLSGRISVADDERTAHVAAGTGRALADFSVIVGHETFSLNEPQVHLRLDETATELRVELFDGNGNLRAAGRTPIAASHSDSTTAAALSGLPPYCSSHGLIILSGALDGDSRTTRVEIGGEPLEVWTESPRQAVVFSSGLPAGRHDFRMSEGEFEIDGSVHVLDLEIEPRSIEAERGTRVPYLVVVDGLDGLEVLQPPILGLSAWTEDGAGKTQQRDTVIQPELADDGRVVIRGEFTVAETGTFHVNGGIRRAPPGR